MLEKRAKESSEKLQSALSEAQKEIEELRAARQKHIDAKEKQNAYYYFFYSCFIVKLKLFFILNKKKRKVMTGKLAVL